MIPQVTPLNLPFISSIKVAIIFQANDHRYCNLKVLHHRSAKAAGKQCSECTPTIYYDQPTANRFCIQYMIQVLPEYSLTALPATLGDL